MRRFVPVLVTCSAVVVTVFAGFSFAGVLSKKTAGTTTDVTVHMTEYSFSLSTNTVPVGTVVFSLINDGKTPHNFSISGMTSADLAPGATATMTVTFTQSGPYPYLCTLVGHAAAGMQGTLTVTGTTPPPKPTATIKVSEKEWKITLKTPAGKLVKSVKHGLIRFKVANVGRLGHNFVIAKHQTPVLARGKSATINVALKKGKYKFLCSVTGHAALGMKGTLLVT